jgi:asparagine synthase (glutamine-hydrolysing)
MKSICGYWALEGQPVPDALSRMRVAGVHCTTPRLTQWEDGALAFGAACWSPQPDLPQPCPIVQHPSTGCVVMADARLDNSVELRAALELPPPDAVPGPDADDAAVLILHAWLRWGEACVERIDGDFAFAIRDPRRECLFLARDRMAGRPLYVHHLPGRLLVFASTSHAVLAHPRVPRDINEARIADFLVEGLEGVDFTSTFHLAVERHAPAHALLVTPQRSDLRRYWRLQPGLGGPLPHGDDAWADALTEALERAVAQRLKGPGRTGSMLSGGLDSTSLAIIAGEQLRAAGRPPLPTFSAIHGGLPGCRETQAVRQLLSLSIFDGHVTDLADLGGGTPGLLRFLDDFDEPFDANMALVDAQYQGAAAHGVDAVIDGIDGDTLFSAGDVLRRQLRAGQWPSALRNARGMTRIYGGLTGLRLLPPLRSALMPAGVRRILWPLRSRQRRRQYVAHSLIHPDFALRIGLDERLERLRALRSLSPWSGPEMEAVEGLQHTFPVVGLERYHRVAARHGVTPLHPFTERRLLELCVNLPDRQRLRDGWSKPVLRHAMRGRMPDPVRWRSDKQHLGWRLNHALWQARQDALHRLLQESRGRLGPYVDLGKVNGLIAQLDGPRPDPVLGQLLYACVLAHWLSRQESPA